MDGGTLAAIRPRVGGNSPGGGKVKIWPYELLSRADPTQKREGALFRLEFEPSHSGYADCHPWPELGDLNLAGQLAAYHTDKGTPLLLESFACALHDFGARRNRLSLFAGLKVPPSHASIHGAALQPEAALRNLERLRSDGFGEVKIKVEDLLESASAVSTLGMEARNLGLKIRLDLNEKSTIDSVSQGLNKISSLADGLEWLDWIEDPCSFNSEDWRRLRRQFNVRLALDFAADPLKTELDGSVDVIVLKPATQDRHKVMKRAAELNLPICVTSYLDHPVGQCYAAWVAATAAKQGHKLETCGLITHTAYQPNAFSERLGTEGPRLIPPSGTGLGFDDLLENLPWEELP